MQPLTPDVKILFGNPIAVEAGFTDPAGAAEDVDAIRWRLVAPGGAETAHTEAAPNGAELTHPAVGAYRFRYVPPRPGDYVIRAEDPAGDRAAEWLIRVIPSRVRGASTT